MLNLPDREESALNHPCLNQDLPGREERLEVLRRRQPRLGGAVSQGTQMNKTEK